MVTVAASYLKGSAFTWFESENIREWNNPLRTDRSFTHLFRKEYCGVHREAQWYEELSNLRQKTNESIETYSARIQDLWGKIDPYKERKEKDRVREFIKGLRSEYLIQVQADMPTTVAQAKSKAKALEIGINMKKSRTNAEKEAAPIKRPVNKDKPAHAGQEEGLEGLIAKFLKQQGQKSFPKCFNCQKMGHYAKDCKSEKVPLRCYNYQTEGHYAKDYKNPMKCSNCQKEGHQAKNYSKGVICFTCKKEGHTSPNCPNNPKNSNKEFRKSHMIEGKELSRQNPYLKD